MSKDEISVLDGSPVEINFAGESYKIRQRARKEQRRLRQELAEVVGVVGSISEGKASAEKIPAMLKMVNMVIDFIEDNLSELSGVDAELYVQKNGLDGMTELIEGVFNPLFEAWVAPFIPTGDDTQKKSIAATKSKRKPMK